jgi:hypothetical protein
VPPCGPVQRVDQLPGSAADAAAVESIKAAEAARMVVFIAVLLSLKHCLFGKLHVDEDGIAFLLGLCRWPGEYCNLLQLDLPLVPCGPRKDNCRYVAKQAPNPRR